MFYPLYIRMHLPIHCYIKMEVVVVQKRRKEPPESTGNNGTS